MQLRFDDEVVAITGAGGGIGRAHALELARRGARVVVNDLGGSPHGGGADPGLADAVVEEIRAAGGEAVANHDTVATPEGGRRIVESALDTWGRLDAVFSNAFITRNAHFEDMTLEDWDDVLAVNVRGAFCVLQPAYRAMMRQGGGRIVIMTSLCGLAGGFGQANYSTSKMALVGLTRALAFDGARHGIRANAIAPSALDSRNGSSFSSDDPSVVGRPESLQFALDAPHTALMTARRVVPLGTVLAHRSCPVTGRIYGAYGGFFLRYFVSENEGWLGDLETSAEDLLAHWDELEAAGRPGTEVTEEAMIWPFGELSRKLAPLLERFEETGRR